MREITDPNWLTVVGLLYATYGSIVLASVATADTGLSDGAQIAGRRNARAAFAILLLALGGGILAAAQFVTMSFGAPIVIGMLVLAFLVVMYVFLADYWGDIVTADRETSSAAAREPLVAPVRVETEPVRLRAAG